MASRVVRETAEQIVRERFGLPAIEPLRRLALVNDVVDHKRSLHVIVPIAAGHVTEVSFVQSPQFIDGTRTNAVLFPPLASRILGSAVDVALHSQDESAGQILFQVVDDQKDPSAPSIADARAKRDVVRIKDGAVLSTGCIVSQTPTTITICDLEHREVTFAWPSPGICMVVEGHNLLYGPGGFPYALVSTEKPISQHADVELTYSLAMALSASLQYVVDIDVFADACAFSTLYTVDNLTREVDFDRVSSLTIVDATHNPEDVLPPRRVYSRSVDAYESLASSSSPPLTLPAAESVVSPTKFTYTRGVTIAPTSSVQLSSGDPVQVRHFLTYQTNELVASRDYTGHATSVLWCNNDDLKAVSLRSAPTKINIKHASGEFSTCTFFWNREDDARYDLTKRGWLAKQFQSNAGTQLHVETTSVTLLANETLMHFTVHNHLIENAVVAFPVFPNQAEGRCTAVESEDGLNDRQDQPWLASAAPQAYAVFVLPSGKRLNFLAHFSPRMQ